MLLAVLVTSGSVGLLVALGWITDKLLRGEADRWARRVTDDREESMERFL
ncbi:hypothetical protein [Kribbella sp. HUAS MG21]|uniref:Uncharacterized protein n=1 Tax=Kribbella sp. HUAS MG21 TaxID=3160966 RepID=A0AAU7T948_9ACTN